MSVAILSPLSGDTVSSPVAVSVAYDFTAGACSLTTSITGSTPSTAGPFSNASIWPFSFTTTTTGNVTATATASPSSGGSNSVAFTIGTGAGGPPIIIETIDPNPPPPPPPPPGPLGMLGAAAPMKDFKAKGSIKGTTITQVRYRVLQVNLGAISWSTVVPNTNANVGGNSWHINSIKFTPAAKCQYALQVDGLDASGNKVAQFTKAIAL
ncbi:MAG: hypothetical protein U0791_01020 [Gemmataceae bacterium]